MGSGLNEIEWAKASYQSMWKFQAEARKNAGQYPYKSRHISKQ